MKKVIDEVFDDFTIQAKKSDHYCESCHKYNLRYINNAIIKILEALPTNTETHFDSDGCADNEYEVVQQYKIQEAIEYIKQKSNQ